VAFNCVGERQKYFDADLVLSRVYVQPAAGDAGLAVGGGVLRVAIRNWGKPRSFVMEHAILGGRDIRQEKRTRAAMESSGNCGQRICCRENCRSRMLTRRPPRAIVADRKK